MSTVQVHIPWRQSKENQQSMEERRRLRFVNKSDFWSQSANNNKNNNISLMRSCQNATCYNDMDISVKKHEMTEVLDC